MHGIWTLVLDETHEPTNAADGSTVAIYSDGSCFMKEDTNKAFTKVIADRRAGYGLEIPCVCSYSLFGPKPWATSSGMLVSRPR